MRLHKSVWTGLGVLGALGGACGGTGAAGVTITFAHYFSAQQTAALQPLIEAFEAKTGIHVQVITFTSSTVVDKLQVMAAAGTFPDVARLGSEYINLPLKTFADLTPYIRRDEVDTSAYYAPTLDAFSAAGRQLALPTALSTYALFYNADRYDKAGLAPPPHSWSDTSWDWNAFVADAKKLSDPSASPAHYAIQSFGTNTMWPWWWGGDWLDAGTHTSLATSAGTVQALQHIADAYRVDHIVGGSFARATAAGVIDGNWSVSTFINDHLPFHWDLAAPPLGTQRKVILYPNGLFMSANSTHQDAAWAFIKYLSANLDTAARLSQVVGRIPSLKQLGPRFVELQRQLRPDVDYQVLINALGYAQYPTTRRVPQAIKVERLINTYWTKMRTGSLPVTSAATELAHDMDALLQAGS